MQTVKYIIIEDDVRHLKSLKNAIATFQNPAFTLEWVADCGDGLEAWKLLQQRQDLQLLFLDYLMPEITGKGLLELLKDRPNPPLVILVSQYPEQALDLIAFYPNIAAPIFKPATAERLQAAMKRAMPLLLPRQRITIDIYFTLNGRRATQIFDIADILYFETGGNGMLWVHYFNRMTQRPDRLDSNADYHTLTHLIKTLPSEHFYRVNQAHIIHRQHIRGATQTELIMQNGVHTGISNHQPRYSQERFAAWYQNS
jgi:DNA-binding LytR/AlgR family response regulator